MSDLQCAVRVLCARHAAAEGSPRLAGDDRPLSRAGRVQADELGRLLAPRRIAHVYTSPLLRGRETADRVANVLGTRCTVDDRLVEFTAGALDASANPDDAARVTAVFQAWLGGDLDRQVGDGETGHEVVGRLSGVLGEVADLHRGETVLLVSHGGLLALGLTTLSANLKPAWVAERPLGNADVVEVAYDADGWVCGSWAGDVPR